MSDTNFVYTDKQGRIIDGPVVNPGGWFGKAWLIGYPLGNFAFFLVVEADNEQDAIDELADSDRWGYAINVPEEDVQEWEEEYGEDISRAGNDGHPVDLENVTIERVPSNLVYVGKGLPDNGLSPKAHYDHINA